MEDYESDSSVSDVDSGITTNVLLGYATKESVDDSFSRLGGEPVWFDSQRPPPAQLARCKNCSSYMALLLQLNGNLPSRFPGHERSLYIWACRRKACRRKEGSMRVVRCTKACSVQQTPPPNSKDSSKSQTNPEHTADQKDQPKDVGSSLFGANPSPSPAGVTQNPFSISNPGSALGSNPFATAPGPASALAAKPPQPPAPGTSNLAQTFAQKARMSSPVAESFPAVEPSITEPEPWPEASQFQKPYPLYYLDADYEYLSPTATTGSNGQTEKSGDTSMYEPLMDSGSSNAGKGKEDAAYESAHDKTFQHFADTLSQNPEQVLRYEFEGVPLLYSRNDQTGHLFAASATTGSSSVGSSAKVSTERPVGTSGLPRCSHCNARRVFELQLTPHAIAELEAEEEAATLLGEGMEWGTAIVAVCSKDCSQQADTVSYVEEWIGVQWEEVVERARRTLK